MAKIVYTSDFDTQTTGNSVVGWTPFDPGSVGVVYKIVTTGPQLAGHTKSMVGTGTFSANTATEKDTISVQDVDLFFYGVTEGLGSAAQGFFGWARGKPSGGTGYSIVSYEGSNTAIYKWVANNPSQIGSFGSPGVNAAANDIIGYRLQCLGSTIRARVWNVTQGQSEPTTWQVSTTDTTYTAASGIGIADNGNSYKNINYVQITDLSAASTYTVTGPAGGLAGIPSTNFTVTPDGTPSASMTVTPSDSGAGGTFSPTTLTFTTSAAQTFTYTPPGGNATRTLSFTHTGGGFSGNDPAPLSYVVTAVTVSSTGYAVSGPSTGTVNTASSNFSITPNGTGPSTTLVVTPTANLNGTITPASLTFAPNSTTPQTFTFTPVNLGPNTLSFAHTGGGFTSDQAPLTYLSTTTGAIPLNDRCIDYSGDVVLLGSAPFTSVRKNSRGVMAKFGFTGTSCTIAFAANTVSNVASALLIIDGNQSGTLAIGTSTGTIAVTGLASGNHQAVLYQSVRAQGANDSWGLQTNAVPVTKCEVTSITIDSGSYTVLPMVYGANILHYGDSITEGTGATLITQAYAQAFAQGINAESTTRGFGGTAAFGIQASPAGVGYVPNLYVPGDDAHSTWNKADWNNSMLNSAGKFKRNYDAVIISLGQNDFEYTAPQFTAAMAQFIPVLRAALPLTTPIYWATPLSQLLHDAILAGVTAVRAAGDKYFFALDLGNTQGIIPTIYTGSATYFTIDSVHPNDVGHAWVAAQYTTVYRQAVAAQKGLPAVGSLPSSVFFSGSKLVQFGN